MEFDEFLQLMAKLRKRREIKLLFNKYSGGNKYMSSHELLEFLHKEQRDMHYSQENINKLIDQFAHSTATARKGWNLEDFEAYLTGPLNNTLSVKIEPDDVSIVVIILRVC